MERFSLVQDTIDRLPDFSDRNAYLKEEMKDKLIIHKNYIRKNGIDMPLLNGG
jgi:xylulose-5-phosphate/fructose-6-phosphate phosphoketolase